MNLNDAYSIVIEYIISECLLKEVSDKLIIILEGIKGEKHIEENKHPKYQSIVLFGHNIFTLRDVDYIEMAEYILANKRTIL